MAKINYCKKMDEFNTKDFFYYREFRKANLLKIMAAGCFYCGDKLESIYKTVFNESKYRGYCCHECFMDAEGNEE